jgi:hypothetical protein
MPQAGVPVRARRRSATPWWEELDREAFQFPTEYRVKPARRAMAVAERPVAADEGTRMTAKRPVATADPAVAAAPRPVAAAPRPVAAAPRPVAAASAAFVAGPQPGAAAAQPARASTPERRTVTIRGRGAERNHPVARPTLRRHERPGFRADRAALWAVMLGVLLILVAATSAHAAILLH